MWEIPADRGSEEWASTAETAAHFIQTLTNCCHSEISKLTKKIGFFSPQSSNQGINPDYFTVAHP